MQRHRSLLLVASVFGLFALAGCSAGADPVADKDGSDALNRVGSSEQTSPPLCSSVAMGERPLAAMSDEALAAFVANSLKLGACDATMKASAAADGATLVAGKAGLVRFVMMLVTKGKEVVLTIIENGRKFVRVLRGKDATRIISGTAKVAAASDKVVDLTKVPSFYHEVFGSPVFTESFAKVAAAASDVGGFRYRVDFARKSPAGSFFTAELHMNERAGYLYRMSASPSLVTDTLTAKISEEVFSGQLTPLHVKNMLTGVKPLVPFNYEYGFVLPEQLETFLKIMKEAL